MYVNVINWIWLWTTPTIPQHIHTIYIMIFIYTCTRNCTYTYRCPTFIPVCEAAKPWWTLHFDPLEWSFHRVVNDYQAEFPIGCGVVLIPLLEWLTYQDPMMMCVCIFTCTPHLYIYIYIYSNIIFLGAWMTIQVELTIWHLFRPHQGSTGEKGFHCGGLCYLFATFSGTEWGEIRTGRTRG